MKLFKYLGSLSVAAALVLTGCGGNSGIQTTIPAPGELLSKMAATAGTMKTWESEVQSKITMPIQGVNTTVDLDVKSTTDLPARRCAIEMSTKTEGTAAVTAAQKYYVIQDIMYLNFNSAASGLDPAVWYKVTMTASEKVETWSYQDIGKQTQTLLDLASIEVIGTEELNGNRVYRVKIQPEPGKFLEYLVQSGSELAGLGITDPTNSFKKIDIECLVDAKNYFLSRIDMDLEVEFEGDAISLATTMTVDKINKGVNIELSEPAKAAVSLG